MIGISLRYDRLDHFWFTLMHEVAHVVSSHQGVHIDVLGAEAESATAEEKEANALARNWLVPDRELARFLSAGPPTRAAILAFARRLGRHPALVVGQLHFREVLPYARFRDLLPKVGEHLEGWITP